jgi:uncharacterized membrane-anchored protein YhcB (DUF1043 family)
MIWAILITTLVLGLAVIRYTYAVQRKKLDKEREEMRRSMDEFVEQLNKYKNEH